MSPAVTVPDVSYGTFAGDDSQPVEKAAWWESFVRKLKESAEDGLSEVLVTVFQLCWHALHFETMVMKLALGAPMVGIGLTYTADCTLEPSLPFILITAGVLLILTVLLPRGLPQGSVNITEPYMNFATTARVCITFVLNGTLFGIFIIACFLVYPNVWPDFSASDGGEYCHPVPFLFSFWLLNVTWVVIISCTIFILGMLTYIYVIIGRAAHA